MQLMDIVDGAGRIRSVVVTVKLSERNLRSLLHKLTEEKSKRTLVRRTSDSTMLYITAESDEEHYKDREPGQMSDSTEDALAAQYASKEVAA